MIATLLWLAAASASGVHPQEVEAHLALLIGDWTRAGKEKTYRDHCIWYDRRSFVVCSLTDSISGLRVEAIVGYSKEDQRYTYQSYSNDGGHHVQYGYAVGNTGLVFTDERKIDGKPARLTTAISAERDGRLHLSQDRSVMGAPWQQAGEVYYIPRR